MKKGSNDIFSQEEKEVLKTVRKRRIILPIIIGLGVVFFLLWNQFDQDEYLNKQGAFVDYENFIFGDIVKNEDDLLLTLKHYCQNGFKEKENHALKRKSYFFFHDQNNCKRIYEAALNFKRS